MTSVKFTPDGKTVAAGSYDEVQLIDVESQESVAKLKVSGQAQALAFSPDGKTLAVGAFRGIELWDVAQRKRLDSLIGHSGYVMTVAFSKDGSQLVSGAEDGTVRVWEIHRSFTEDSAPAVSGGKDDHIVQNSLHSPRA